MDPTPLDAYAIEPPLGPTENAYRLVCALLDPAVRALANGEPRGSIELHWDRDKGVVTVNVRHTSRHTVRLRAAAVIPHSTR